MAAVLAVALAFGPLAAALLAIGAVFVTGFDQRAAMPPQIEALAYGFFLDRYPLFAAAIVYGLAAMLVAMIRPGPTGLVRRLLGGAAGTALVLGASLYPTFGGIVLRSAFGTGGISFLGQQPMAVAFALGSAASAFVFGLVLGIGRLLTMRRAPQDGRRRDRLIRAAGTILLRYLALWFALAVLGLAHAAGFGPWPHRPLTGGDALLASVLTLAAFLPHACLDWRVIGTRHPTDRP